MCLSPYLLSYKESRKISPTFLKKFKLIGNELNSPFNVLYGNIFLNTYVYRGSFY